ncbi:ABC transporter permease [Cohnella fermenti]|uniref:ABC transporter permease n=1 Tax=Cohnella fermenti TaxID=2565925 RepID=A0A4S4C5U3_9BACL|nr:ABC transporter permease [Cohnella fermenti]THF82613.1 ABC transporter permease [Cohnella fermenti]
MVAFVLRKVSFMVVTLFLLASLTFVLMNVIPGSPLQSEKATSEQVKKNLEAYYGLDKPMFERYINYMDNLIHGDLGVSMKKKYQTVERMISSSFGYSLRLGLASIVTSVIGGCVLGILAALYHRRFLDHFSMTLAVIGLAVPSLILGPLLQYIFAVKLGWFSVAGLKRPLDYILPTIALSASSIAVIARLIRSTMVEVLNGDFIKTAKAKGLAGHMIVWRHALRNSMLPVVTYLGFMIANVITGSVVVEQIFAIPGLGKFFVSSIVDRDYPLIMGTTIFYAVILLIGRFVADIAYVLVDPRIRLKGGKAGA